MTYIDKFPKKEKETHIPEECKLLEGEVCLWLVFCLFFVFFKLASSLKTELWAVPVELIYLILA